MNNSQIETAQNVHLFQNIANLGDRTLAYVVDLLIIFAYELIIIVLFNLADLTSFNRWVYFGVLGLPLFLYHLVMETFNNGQSLGKAILKIRVVKTDGTSPAFSNFLIRWLLRIVDFSMTSGAVAIVSYLLTGRGQRLGDLAAGTTVISEKQNMTVQQTLNVNIPSNYTAVYPQVTIFSDRDMEKIKNLLKTSQQKHNYAVIDSLARKTAEVMEVSIKEDNNITFLQTVILDYNYYTQG